MDRGKQVVCLRKLFERGCALTVRDGVLMIKAIDWDPRTVCGEGESIARESLVAGADLRLGHRPGAVCARPSRGGGSRRPLRCQLRRLEASPLRALRPGGGPSPGRLPRLPVSFRASFVAAL